jgi:hypothetical protein
MLGGHQRLVDPARPVLEPIQFLQGEHVGVQRGDGVGQRLTRGRRPGGRTAGAHGLPVEHVERRQPHPTEDREPSHLPATGPPVGPARPRLGESSAEIGSDHSR